MHFVQTMAYANQVPWHGLGHQLASNEPLEVWAEQAGMNWRIESAQVRFAANNGLDATSIVPDQKVLYRSDTKAPLSIVSNRYQVVQPAEILEFYRDLTDISGFELETAGVLKEGKKFWALARTGQDVMLRGGDQVNGYLLLATACDGTLATTAQFTSIRVVCNNTLAVALGDSSGAVKVSHRSAFDAQAVKQQLGIAIISWSSFSDYIKELAACRMTEKAVEAFLAKLFSSAALSNGRLQAAVNERAIQKVLALYSGNGMGAEMSSAKGTAWGLVNSVTECRPPPSCTQQWPSSRRGLVRSGSCYQTKCMGGSHQFDDMKTTCLSCPVPGTPLAPETYCRTRHLIGRTPVVSLGLKSLSARF